MRASGGPHDREMAAMRRRNVATCIVVMRDQGAMTLTELARVTGLSRTTVESILDELTERGMVRPAAPPANSGAGRPARRYEFNAGRAYVLGVDVGPHTIRVMLVDLAGKVHVSDQVEAVADASPRDRIEAIRQAMREALRAAGISDHQVYTAVAAVPGIIAPDGTVILSNPVPEWTGAHFSSLLGEGFDFPVVIENDVNMAALAEHATGAAQLVDDIVYVHLGHRMSAALIIGGRLHRGRHFAAGEVANLAPTGWAIREDGEIRAPARFGARSARGVLAAARLGDPEATALIEALAAQIAPGVATLGATLDPDIVVIGGGLSLGGDTLLEPLRREVGAVFDNREAPTLVPSELGARASVLGAVVRGLEIVATTFYAADEPSVPRLTIPPPSGDGSDRAPTIPPPSGDGSDRAPVARGVGAHIVGAAHNEGEQHVS